MPYIERDARKRIDEGARPTTVGELNYAITQIVLAAPDRRGKSEAASFYQSIVDEIKHMCERYLDEKIGVRPAPETETRYWPGLRYEYVNDVIGAVQCARMELKRRRTHTPAWPLIMLTDVAERFYNEVAVPYEKVKIAQNGDLKY